MRNPFVEATLYGGMAWQFRPPEAGASITVSPSLRQERYLISIKQEEENVDSKPIKQSNFQIEKKKNVNFGRKSIDSLSKELSQVIFFFLENLLCNGHSTSTSIESLLVLILQMDSTSPLSLIKAMATSHHQLLLSLALIIFITSSSTVQAFIGTYGVNYGKIADNLPPPESVVTLLKAAKIKNIRIYDADQSVLKAFSKSGIEIVVGIGNEFLKDMSVYEDRAMDWVKANVEPYLPDTHIRGIAVGNEILGHDEGGENAEVLLGAVKNVYSAVNRLRLTNVIQISSPHSSAVFANSFPPSACVFKESVMQYMKPLLEFFSQIGSPFFINAYPFLAYISDPEHIDLNYALFQKNPGIQDPKTNLHYDNMFDAQVDAAYAALAAAGFNKTEVIVSETGWASKGDPNEVGATEKNARTYNYNLRKRLLKKNGTPLKPKTPVKAYVFALFNENLKPGPLSERNFGLFKPDGSISYDIGFTGIKSSSPASPLLSFKDIRAGRWSTPYSMLLATCASLLFLVLAS